MWLGTWFLGAALSQGIVFEPALGRAPEGTWIARAGSVVACVREGGLGIALLGDARHGAALSLDFGGEWPRLEGETCRTLTRLRGRERWSGESVFARARWSSVAPGVDLVLREGGVRPRDRARRTAGALRGAGSRTRGAVDWTGR
jgi:hypothetical protein